eukprot:763262-Hanusia_phi.AAC.1
MHTIREVVSSILRHVLQKSSPSLLFLRLVPFKLEVSASSPCSFPLTHPFASLPAPTSFPLSPAPSLPPSLNLQGGSASLCKLEPAGNQVILLAPACSSPTWIPTCVQVTNGMIATSAPASRIALRSSDPVAIPPRARLVMIETPANFAGRDNHKWARKNMSVEGAGVCREIQLRDPWQISIQQEQS